MAPSAIYNSRTAQRTSWTTVNRTKFAANMKRLVFGRSNNIRPIRIKEGRGNYYITDDGSEIYDASGGAAVSILAKNDKRPINAAYNVRIKGLSYVPNLNFEAEVVERLAQVLLDSTGGKLKQACFYGSGMMYARFPDLQLINSQDQRQAKQALSCATNTIRRRSSP